MLIGERRQDMVDDVVRVLVLQAVGLFADGAELLARAQTARRGDGDAGVDAALEAGHADHEELVEVRGEDRAEIGAFEQRNVFVLGKLEDTLVELQPAEFAVEEPVWRQRLLAFLGLPLVVLVCLGDVLSNLAAQNRLRGCVKNLCHTTTLGTWLGVVAAKSGKFSRCLHFGVLRVGWVRWLLDGIWLWCD